MRRWGIVAFCFAVFPIGIGGAQPRKGDFLQDYLTYQLWMKHDATDMLLRDTIGRWVVDAMRGHSPSRLASYADDDIVVAVQRHCEAQPEQTLTVATFLASQRLPE
ncbi:hypothetical protein [Bosea sp. BH3]|uniref:hypothetical protein n=1 Tax=Bosea sp. BH3 TaxID=2871701 RepID=UPI0021CB2826|nr:hypothetical protein [Bosea sp. BH3]MCU4178252.1 hypothetical protein [Bosea sp. BH3]